ncbi:uncharacterized protein EKO05_0001074 [Ascochyta rabiei]|uniref:Uncharacterized protein n=1 Tax=Didymella rabiei TaxID=5454 RepID=A0A162WCS9_DIDRA|nr:uncharacterized protein EKO05_0001074 [Ascochyta rabiei]KZM18956.1 hypothetical protein ST47_g9902 [Ascochyta rabiei]UPX10413.1 hypothetical protein EKO05_0001074 [Ascochyta rabiei]
MSKKSKNVRNGIPDTEAGWQKILNVSKQLGHSQTLENTQLKRLPTVANNKSSSRGAKKQREFLSRIHTISLYHYLLCAISFSQNELDSTRASVLEALVNKITSSPDDAAIIHSGVRTLAASLNIRQAERPPQFTNAVLKGTKEVFREHMSDMIRKVLVENVWKAAVTMDFPSWPTPDNTVPCLMSLDICEKDVQELFKTLFNAKADWVAGVLHIVHESGMTQIVPRSEITLKGVSDQAIIAIFGTEIHAAITECPVRVKELADGRRLTECVSMIISGREGTVSLAVGLRGGVHIQGKLYR